MENLKQKQIALYKKWIKKREYSYFTKDGILNYDVWEKTSPKIMFLLKETADDFINIADKDIDIRDGKGNHFWWNITYWKYVINQLYLKNTSFDFIPKEKLPEASNSYILNDIAYVNIKKECENKSKSDDTDINKYAQNDKALLKEQIDLISPNIIFCSATTYKAYINLYNDITKLNNNCFKHNNRLIIKYYHPSYFQIKGGRKTLFNNLKNILLSDDILGEFKW